MTDNEIIKALECCFINNNCTGCPLQSPPTKECLKVDCNSALDLIKRQQAEIERLKECPKCLYAFDGEVIEACVQGPCPVEKTIETIKGAKGHNGPAGEPGEGGLTAQWLAGVNAEIERLKETANPYRLHYENLKAEIIREFADRLYDRAFRTTINDGGIECYTKVVAASEIYDLVREMTEGDDGKE